MFLKEKSYFHYKMSIKSNNKMELANYCLHLILNYIELVENKTCILPGTYIVKIFCEICKAKYFKF